MTERAPNLSIATSSGAPTHVVVATHSREIKTALFLALNSDPMITIVATATSTAEMITYWQAFQPEVVIVESGLPGKPLGPVVAEIGSSAPGIRILVIDEHATADLFRNTTNVEVFTDLDQLISQFPEKGAETR
jgi:chemotaxis response regulator CheB